MDVRIAEEPDDILGWTGRAVALDVLRFSTTACELTRQSRPELRVYRGPEQLTAGIPADGSWDVFSELEFEIDFDYFDNSPHLARVNPSGKPAAVSTRSGTKTVADLRGADEVLIGCFANFSRVVERLREGRGPVLLAPACVYTDKSHLEDVECALALRDALKGIDSARGRIEAFLRTERIDRFKKARPATWREDLDIVFRVDGLDVLPTAEYAEGFARLRPLF